MTIIAYDVEDEERRLKSYLQRATVAVYNQKNEDDALQIDAPTDGDNIDENDDENSGADDRLIHKRVYCCKTSRSLYCPECCRVLVPKACWPRRFIRQQQNNNKDERKQMESSFPFQSMDIVLGVKERRTSSTGIQMMCISNMIAEATVSSTKIESVREEQRQHHKIAEHNIEETESSGTIQYSDEVNCNARDTDDTNGCEWWRNIKLYDLNRGDKLPQYSTSQNGVKSVDEINFIEESIAATEEYEDGTYVLFPQEGISVPISSVAKKIKKLIVLDIKWTRSYNVRLFSANHHKIMVSKPSDGGGGKSYNPLASLRFLPFVHLEYPPQHSQFWRWHNRGAGMLSTIEAIYFAAREVSVARQQRMIDDEEEQCDESQQRNSHRVHNDSNNFLDILWLFALQRSIIKERNVKDGRPVAFSEEAKAMARALRNQDPTGL